METQLDKITIARILVVDDNYAMRKTIALVVEDEHDLSICGEAKGMVDALEQCKTVHPDLALIDLSLNGENGLDLIKRLRTCAPGVRVVVFSLHDEPFYISGAREAGAQGYVIKSEGIQQLLACIHEVLDGHKRFPRPEQPSTTPP